MVVARFFHRVAYGMSKIRYSLGVVAVKLAIGQLQSRKESYPEFKKSMLSRPRMTALHRYFGGAMAPTLGTEGEILLVRLLPYPSIRHTYAVGDVVALLNPENHEEYLVRRLAALKGAEMISTNMKDEPFVIGKDSCWVLSDNFAMDLKEVQDSRTWGPITVNYIIGRVLYRFRSSTDHGYMESSNLNGIVDKSVLEFELDVAEMAKKLTETEQKDFH